MIPGESIPITIGTGGQVASAGLSSGSPGGTTSFGSYLVCSGGGSTVGENWLNIGSCGAAGGAGLPGTYIVTNGGGVSGGQTPLGYGSGGMSSRCNGCSLPNPSYGSAGMPGVVIVDAFM